MDRLFKAAKYQGAGVPSTKIAPDISASRLPNPITFYIFDLI